MTVLTFRSSPTKACATRIRAEGIAPALVRFDASDPYALYALDAYTRRPQSRFVGSATRAAVCQLAVNDHGGDAADAVPLRLRGPRTLVHVHHLHVTRRTRDSVHERALELCRRFPLPYAFE